MISYAQNFEDVILNRVYKDRDHGFYIDVGAMDPVLHSVTKYFYDRGWRGINIEPNDYFFQRLEASRPEDINLNVALGEQEDAKLFYVFEEYGVSTFDAESRDRFLEQGFELKQKTVALTTLSAVCQQHVTQPIDFLKVDCEGWEKKVLAGADWKRFRPTVVIVEATIPGTPEPNWDNWEHLLTDALYEMVYFDGLNRFYLRSESMELKTHFQLPPNVFDEFQLHATVQAEISRDSIRGERDAATASLRNAQMRVSELESERAQRSKRICELEQSRAELCAQLLVLQEKTGVLENEISRLQKAVEVAETRYVALEKDRAELERSLQQARLWVGRLSQDIAANNRWKGR